MRVLFLCGESAGGAVRSTLELADRLVDRGHMVDVVLGDRPGLNSPAALVGRAFVKTRRWRFVEGLGRSIVRRTGRALEGPLEQSSCGFAIYRARQPENVFGELMASGGHQVVIANSLPRLAMEFIADDLRTRDIPLVLYLREQHSLTHLTVTGLKPDAVVANSLDLSASARAAGAATDFIPSVVDLSGVTVESTREAVVLVNPIRAHRPELVIGMAAALPHIPFVLQESWPLPGEMAAGIDEAVATHANLTFRSRTADPRDIYRDARVVLAPYPSGRPRVVLEAQHNGIPVIGLDQPSMKEAIGPGGVVIAAEAPCECWKRATESMWADSTWYESLVDASRRWAARDEVQPDFLLERFERVLDRVTGRADG